MAASPSIIRSLVAVFLLAIFSCVACISYWVSMPLVGIYGIGLIGVMLLLAKFARAGKLQRLFLGVAGIGGVLVPIGYFCGSQRTYVFDFSHVLIAWLMAAGFWLTFQGTRESALRRWSAIPAFIWALLGSVVWLMWSYLKNDSVQFHLAVLLLVVLLIVLRKGFSLRPVGIILVHTVIGILVVLPIADFFIRPKAVFNPSVDDGSRLYSFEVAKHDPSAFAGWWNSYVEQFHKMMSELGSSGSNPHTSVLAPRGHATFFQCEIRINNKGFRGADIADEKGSAYRIIALGESTTFGATIRPDDRPWPEVLEQIIRGRMKPERPVQVINAGISAMDLPANLERFSTELLPIQPDMIISYHGFNGFSLLNDAMPRTYGHYQPAYHERPLKLLARVEYSAKMLFFRNSLIPKTSPSRFAAIAPLETDYAAAYEKLIQIAVTNRIRLALANFSMAVNEQSSPDVVGFYRTGFPSVHWQIEANKLHSRLISDLVREHPDVIFVDTHPNLDGYHEEFIDLVHFTQSGRDRLAENVFQEIKPVLEKELNH